MAETTRMISFVAPISLIADIEGLVKCGRYTHMSDAWRGVARLGVELEHGKKEHEK